MNKLAVGDMVFAKITGNEGIITVIHDGAAKIKITKGNSPITDYYLADLELIQRAGVKINSMKTRFDWELKQ